MNSGTASESVPLTFPTLMANQPNQIVSCYEPHLNKFDARSV